MKDHALPTPVLSPLLSEKLGDAITHGYFTREGGVSEGIYRGLNVGLGSHDARAHVEENRARVGRWFGASADRLATLHQVHSPDVVVVDAAYDGSRPQADAMVTATPGLVLGVLSADCGPVLFADPDAGIIGAAHAGWKGALTACSKAPSMPWSRSALTAKASSPASARRSAGAITRSARNSSTRFLDKRRWLCRFLHAVAKRGPCDVRPAGTDHQTAQRTPASPPRTSISAPMRMKSASFPIAAPPIAGAGLRPADFCNHPYGRDDMALHFSTGRICGTPGAPDGKDARGQARCPAALRAGKHVLADRLRHVRLLLLPDAGGEGRWLDGAPDPLGRSAPGASHLRYRATSTSGSTGSMPTRPMDLQEPAHATWTCSAPASASNMTHMA